MGLILTETFELIDSPSKSNIAQLGWANGVLTNLSFQDGPFPNSRAIQHNSHTSGTELVKSFNSTGPDFYFALYIYVLGAGNWTTSAGDSIRIQDNGVTQLMVRPVNDGTIQLRRGPTTVIETSTETFNPNQWNRIEVYGTIGSSGWCRVDVNGINFIDFSGNTQNTSNPTFNELYFGYTTGSSGANKRFTWFVAKDDNEPLGEYRLTTIHPNGDGDVSNFVPDSGQNWERVNDETIDGDTSYVQSSAIGTTDLYTFPSVASKASEIKGIFIRTFAAQQDISTLKLQHKTKINNTEYEVGSEELIGTKEYVPLETGLSLNPDTSAAWSPSDIGNLQSGFEIK